MEGQKRVGRGSEEGLYATYNHDNHSFLRITNPDSWSTCHNYPIIMLQDNEKNQTWYFEQESCDFWTIEVCSEGYQTNSALCVFLSSAYEKCGGWHKILKPGECYETKYAVYDCVDGGFEEAVADLCKYKRHYSLMSWEDGYPPVCFNDYMNCLWGLPTKEKLIPLIDKSKDLGCEVFCIDDGWHKGADGSRTSGLGTWDINDALFGDGGLKSVIDYVKSKGMMPGIWLEMESAGSQSYIAQHIENSTLTRHGKEIGGERRFVNFKNQKTKKYLKDVIDKLYSIGIRYIKNDYNQTIGVGTDGEECMAENLMQNSREFLSFIRDIQKEYPDLYIENCCSGAMRCDNETLKNFRVQSTSDQEYYENYPSILQGMMALMPPEKCGIWVYPYPVPIQERETFAPSEEFKTKFSDGKVTVFNVITGFFGCFYMSGRIDCADEYNTSLIKEGIDLYKDIRHLIPVSHPIYPTGLARMDRNGFLTFGLFCDRERTIMLGIWKKDTTENEFCVDLSKYAHDFKIKQVYPEKFDNLSFHTEQDKICVRFPDGNTAIFFVIEY